MKNLFLSLIVFSSVAQADFANEFNREILIPRDQESVNRCEAKMAQYKCEEIKKELKEHEEHFESCGDREISIAKYKEMAVLCAPLAILAGTTAYEFATASKPKTPPSTKGFKAFARKALAFLSGFGIFMSVYELGTEVNNSIALDGECYNNTELKELTLQYENKKNDFLLSKISQYLTPEEKSYLAFTPRYLNPNFIKTLPCQQMREYIYSQQKKQTLVLSRLFKDNKISYDPRAELPISEETKKELTELRKVSHCLNETRKFEMACAVGNLIVKGKNLGGWMADMSKASKRKQIIQQRLETRTNIEPKAVVHD